MFAIRSTRILVCAKYANTTRRGLGITDKLMDFATQKMENKRENQFKDMVNLMVATPDWNLKSWKSMLESQLGSWVMYIPGMSNSNEVKTVKQFKGVLDKMTDREMENPASLKGPDRERIASVSGESVDDVVKMIQYFNHTKIIATWLQLKSSLGEKLPETEVEMQRAQEDDPRIREIANRMTAASRKGKKSGRGRGNPF